ncbi:MAG: PQQ-binding-like beta-propeller repeat protein [Thermoplasmata archaeon]|nr:PQQ-binding-like beta-propeller repeat protein [Thermoplasmata archaeon]
MSALGAVRTRPTNRAVFRNPRLRKGTGPEHGPLRPILAALGTLGVLAALVAPSLAVPAAPLGTGAAIAPLETVAAHRGSSSAFVHWTTFAGSENRSGYSPFPGPASPAGAWYTCPSIFAIRAGPVTDGSTVYVGDVLGRIYALNRSANGSVRWNQSVGGGPTQLDVAGSDVYVGTTAGELLALWSSNGSVDWRVPLGSRVIQSVSVVGDRVLVGTAGGSVVSLNATTGSVVWTTGLGAGVGGGVAVDGAGLFVPTVNGTVDRLDGAGQILWSAKVGASIDTAVAVDGADVLVADLSGNLTDLWASNGTQRWEWSGRSIGVDDPIEATPAVDPQRVYVSADSGSIRAYDRSNGTLLWQTPGEFTGVPNDLSPAASPGGIFAVVNGVQEVVDLSPQTGNATWVDPSPVLIYGAPAIDNAQLLIGTEFGCVGELGAQGAARPWPVSGVVDSSNGTPIAGALVTIGTAQTSTDANGTFSLPLKNGTYPVGVFAPGFDPLTGTIQVTGPIADLTLVLRPLTLFEVSGLVVDGWSGVGLVGVTVDAAGPLGYDVSTTTGPGGAFRFGLPNGTTTLRVGAFGGYDAAAVEVGVGGAPVVGARIGLVPAGSETSQYPGWPYVLALPVAALTLAGVVAGVREHNRRRSLVGLAPGVLSPFARFVAMRLLLLPFQVMALLAIVYLFGTLLPVAATHASASVIDPAVGPSCTIDLGHLGCDLTAYASGFGTMLQNLFTGQWGWARFGVLQEPVTQFFQWWLPDSIQLGVISLGFSMAVAYPLALLAGWRRKGAFDVASRLASLAGLLVPSFLLALLVILAVGVRFQGALGDLPFGTLPSDYWFVVHGGFPAWVGTGDETDPTHFPLIDGLLHRDWAFEEVVAAKVLIQAAAISVVYVTIFLRHAWSVVSHAAHEPHVQAARARGVSESTLLWRHTGRRVLPYYVLTFALTLPAFVGTQALVEALFSAQGIGSILLLEITNLSANPPGFSGPISGNIYQVIVFLLVLFILLTTLLADIVARYLDPRLRAEET